MHGLIIALTIISVALLILYHMRLHASVKAHLGDEENTIHIGLDLAKGLIRQHWAIAFVRDADQRLTMRITLNGKTWRSKKKRKPKDEEKTFDLPDQARNTLIRHVDLESLAFSLTLGIACDAAVTAKLCGLALTVLESAAALVRTLKPNARVLMRSAPNFRRDCLRARLSCIFSLKLGHIILVAAQAAVEQTKGAFAAWLIRLKASCVPPWKTSRT